MTTQQLTRAGAAQLGKLRAEAPAPIRLVHLGLGAFHRAHQVWYTQASEADPAHPEWGYCSFTGRSPRMSDLLSAQDGLYTLVTRSGEGDSPEIIESLVAAEPAQNVDRLTALLAARETAVVTLTITEAGYHLAEGLELDAGDPDVAHDIQELRSALSRNTSPALVTAAGKLVLGLGARRSANAGGLAAMSCDNIAANGATTRSSVLGLARAVDTELAAWIEENVSFPSTSIDRITPAAEEALGDEVAEATGFSDAAPVVTEPFASWVISGEFPAGRPEWERGGAEFVTDIEPFENRKLWLLNGSHSLMAYYGQLRGHATVAEAIADPECRRRVEALWDEAARHLTLPELAVPEYRAALIRRFENPRIRHNLAQIAIDGATKQRMRAVPILKAELDAGRDGSAAVFSIAGWIAFVQREVAAGREVKDTRSAEIAEAANAADPVAALLAVLDLGLARNADVLAQVRDHLTTIGQD